MHTSVCTTWRGRLSIKHVTPNNTSKKLVKIKALTALVIFWIFLSLLGGLWENINILIVIDDGIN